MTRSTHIDSPEPADVRALLDATGWSARYAAELAGVTESVMHRAAKGAPDSRTGSPYRLDGRTWALLQIYARQSVRDALPEAPLP